MTTRVKNCKTLYYHFVGKILWGNIGDAITCDDLHEMAFEKIDAETIKKYLPHAIQKLVRTTWVVPTDEVQRSRRDPKTYNPVYLVNETKRKFVLEVAVFGGDKCSAVPPAQKPKQNRRL